MMRKSETQKITMTRAEEDVSFSEFSDKLRAVAAIADLMRVRDTLEHSDAIRFGSHREPVPVGHVPMGHGTAGGRA